MAFIPITEASLRTAMRDRRYWQSGHPEREAYVGWVTNGWHALDRMQGRGLPPSAIESTVRPEHFVGANRGAHIYWDPGNRVMVVIDPRTNTVITAIPRATRPNLGGSTR